MAEPTKVSRPLNRDHEYGDLRPETAQAVMERLRDMLTGRVFHVVEIDELDPLHPAVRPNEMLTEPVRMNDSGWITFSTGSYTYFFDPERVTTRSGATRHRKYSFKGPYQVTLEDIPPAGQRRMYVITVYEPDAINWYS